MKVLLVDDEMITIRMLQSLIPWEQLGLELMGYAQDGEEAYKMALEEMPDIILTDIRMKNMDGLQLVEKIFGLSKTVKIILMSAYADFAYVKEAIRLGCSNYILKPVDENELEQSLRKVMDEIRGKQYEKTLIDKSEKQLRMLELYKYMRTGSNLNKILEHKNEYPFDFMDYSMVLIQRDNDSIDEYVNTSSMELVQEKYVLHMLEQIIGADCSRDFLSMDYEDDAWIFLLEKTKVEETVKICETIVTTFQKELELKVLICFSKPGYDLKELPELYEQVKNLRKYAFYIGDERILGYDYNCVGKEIDQLRNIGLLREAEQALKDHDTAYLEEVIAEAFQASATYHPDALHDIYEFCYRLLYAIRKSLETEKGDCGIAGEELSNYDLTYEQLKELYSLKKLKTVMDEAVELLKGVHIGGSGKKYSKPVEESLRIIEKNYNKNLSLEEISEEIAVSKNYFCYLFKREVGVSLWNYLTQIRMKYAKKLLEETELKTYEIAFEVGYDNPSYFSKIFKKIESVTPNEYRAGKREYSDRKQ